METAVSNWENHEHQRYFWNVIVLQKKSQSGMRILNRIEERVLIFAVISHNTINIPKIFQVFMIFPIALLQILFDCTEWVIHGLKHRTS